MADVRRVRIGLARRRRTTVRDGRQTRAAAEGRSGRVCKGRDAFLSRGERGRVHRLRRVLVRVGILARRRGKRRGQTTAAGRLLVRRRRRVLSRARARDDF